LGLQVFSKRQTVQPHLWKGENQMKQSRSIQHIAGLILCALFLGACSPPTPPPPTATPTATATAAPTPTPTLTPTETATATYTDVPATPTSAVTSSQGGVMLAQSESQLIMYGKRLGSAAETAQVVDAKTFNEVKTQQALQLTLNGGGPMLFSVFPDQQFSNGKGGTALATMSMGATDDPNVYVVAMWTSDINMTFLTGEALSAHQDVLSVQNQPVADQSGWLEHGKLALSAPNLAKDQQQEGFEFILFHAGDQVYILGFLPGFTTVVPAEDQQANGMVVEPGQDHTYRVKGFLGGSVSLPLQMMAVPVPILQVSDIEWVK
jgi:hypothetical protein